MCIRDSPKATVDRQLTTNLPTCLPHHRHRCLLKLKFRGRAAVALDLFGQRRNQQLRHKLSEGLVLRLRRLGLSRRCLRRFGLIRGLVRSGRRVAQALLSELTNRLLTSHRRGHQPSHQLQVPRQRQDPSLSAARREKAPPQWEEPHGENAQAQAEHPVQVDPWAPRTLRNQKVPPVNQGAGACGGGEVPPMVLGRERQNLAHLNQPQQRQQRLHQQPGAPKRREAAADWSRPTDADASARAN